MMLGHMAEDVTMFFCLYIQFFVPFGKFFCHYIMYFYIPVGVVPHNAEFSLYNVQCSSTLNVVSSSGRNCPGC